MGFFGSLWSGVKAIGSGIKKAARWVGERLGLVEKEIAEEKSCYRYIKIQRNHDSGRRQPGKNIAARAVVVRFKKVKIFYLLLNES